MAEYSEPVVAELDKLHPHHSLVKEIRAVGERMDEEMTASKFQSLTPDPK